MLSDQRKYEKLITLGRRRERGRGLHKHRIIPGYEGGKYDSGNVIYLTRAEHIRIHRLRWKLFSNWRDLRACNLLGDKLTDDEWLLCATNGGLTAGIAHAKNRTGVCGRSKAKMSHDGRKGGAAVSRATHSRGGKTTGNWLKANGLGIFGISPEQDRLNRAKGGHITMTNLSYQDRVKGFLGTKWVTDGKRRIRLKPTESIPQGFRLGRGFVNQSKSQEANRG